MTGYVKRNYAKEQLKRNHGHRNHRKRNDLTIVANNKLIVALTAIMKDKRFLVI